MAKKAKKAAKKVAAKKAKKAAAKTAAKKWTSGRGADRAAEAKKTTKAPKNVPLFKGLRIAALDKIAGQIADTRDAMNRLRKEEGDLERHAHRLMRDHKQMTWSAHGVELARVPGDEKLRIRTSRESSTAPAEEEVVDPQAEEKTGAEEPANTGGDDVDHETPGSPEGDEE